MAITPPPPSGTPRPRGTPQPWREGTPQLPKIPGRVALLLLIPLLLVLGVCYWWFVQRKEVNAGEVLVLMRKVGASLPAEADGQVVLYPALLKKLGEPADSVKYKGILYEVKPEGRYFRDPFLYERTVCDATFIEQDEIGILIRKYGEPLPPGKIVATEPHERGPLAEILRPGRHNINPFAYDVKRVKPVRIQEGSVGVQTLFSGQDPANPNRYVVEKGERGVQPDVLPPGLYYNNPYVRRIDIIDVRSHTLDLSERDAILFPSKDSFQIIIEGTVEYAVRQDMAPYVKAAIGDHEDVREKLIIPYMKSFARIEGSKLEAREFISGETRKAFQDRVFEGLRQQCSAQGIEIRATLIRRIEPPAAIANPISDRQVAEQQINQYHNEIKLAESQARLVEQEEMQKQNQEVGEANREVVTMTMQAEQQKAVALTEANKRLEVAKLELEAAKETAAALVSRGQAAAEIILLDYEAEAKPLSDAINAFGGGEAYAQYFFYQKLGPAVKSVLASTEGPFADIFRSLSNAAGTGVANPQPKPE
jgi:regulator of protease activity HflC (stomatin/prohibitin superfamily)